ncbi:N-acetyl sugar amidotransferase [Gelidibacter sp. F63206]|uniref:N-acetyl sugar amidotransferase n=1 Tax=Gelidibacter sp. F63206 TaxID=2926425 RepID=UPI001FF5D181|nr:N-acetyl sugar amidotransferase [Gelidibacter sp. F63206]MCK0115078.1 N-acetyl sugar amidotransferase [Gelidibacter sp. F63206]
MIIKNSKYHPDLFSSVPYQMCTKTVMDTTDPKITFDKQGVSNHYYEYQQTAENDLLEEPKRTQVLEKAIAEIKANGKGKKYDCLIGLSGGVDSSYVAYLVQQYGLRPLAVHFDNGWNSELAVHNVNSIIESTGFDLHTIVVNWEEFRDLQLSYLKASVIDIEVVSDHAIQATMFKLASKFDIDYIISGTNIVTEFILPKAWIYTKLDYTNLRNIHRQFGHIKLDTYPRVPFWKLIKYTGFKKLVPISILDFVDYNKQDAIDTIVKEFDWRDYGGKHCESLWTKFYQNHILPEKFGVDKRKAHLSTLICSGQITREDALAELQTPIYDEAQLFMDKEYVLKKLNLSVDAFEDIMKKPPVPHEFYGTNEKLRKRYITLLESTSAFRKLFK